MPDPADGGGEGSSSGDNKGGGDKKEEGGAGKHKKLLRLLTVMAYLSTVSGTAFMLSLYYLFLWTPKVQLGGKALVQDPPPPSSMALFYPEMAPHLAARMADEHETSKASGPQWAARTQPRPTGSTRRKTKGNDASESQVPATPQLALPAMKEAEAAFAARRREARSTIMDTTTPSSTSATHPTTATTGRDAGHRGRTPTAPPPTPHRGAAKGGGGGGEQWHSTPPPHPAEIAVHA